VAVKTPDDPTMRAFNGMIDPVMTTTRVRMVVGGGWSCQRLILQFGNACWSFFTPSAVTLVSRSSKN